MADPLVNFFKSTLVGTYSDADNSITIATGDGALLPDPSTDGAYNLTIFEGLQVTGSTEFEIVRVTARSGDVLTVTRGAESTTPLTIGSATHSILMSATKKTFDDINSSIENINLTTLSGVESITYDNTGDEVLQFPVGTTAQRPLSPATGYIRYNSDRESIEFYNGTNWLRLQSVEFNTLSLGVATATVTGNDATTLTNVIANAERLTFNSSGDESFSLPAGTEAQRPSASAGYMRYNTDEDVIEAYIDGEWVQMDTSGYPVQNVQGTVSGYMAGGAVSGAQVTIDKFSLSSDQNATDVGDLGDSGSDMSGHSSETHGYVAGGRNRVGIEKYSFATDGNATSVGSLATEREDTGGGASSAQHGYSSGGRINSTYKNEIEKFAFATDGNATDVGDLTLAGQSGSGQSSSTHGYYTGRYNGSIHNRIDKFSFSSDANATDVGDTTVAIYSNDGNQSSTHGYSLGGWTGSASNIIQKFSFASDGNATDVGDLTHSASSGAGQSSTTHGYKTGGSTAGSSSSGVRNDIQKHSFASDSNGTDVGDLTQGRIGGAGAQV